MATHPPEIAKTCSRCKQVKQLTEFSPQSNGPLGRRSACKACQAALASTRREHDPIGHRRRVMKSRYGLTPEQYDAMYVSQQEGCAICARPQNSRERDRPRSLCVDHDHDTGRIRGLLCHSCNIAIGYLPTPEYLERAIAYLRSAPNWGHVPDRVKEKKSSQ